MLLNSTATTTTTRGGIYCLETVNFLLSLNLCSFTEDNINYIEINYIDSSNINYYYVVVSISIITEWLKEADL